MPKKWPMPKPRYGPKPSNGRLRLPRPTPSELLIKPNIPPKPHVPKDLCPPHEHPASLLHGASWWEVVVMLGIFLLVLLVGALFVVPYFLPMRDYMPKVQQLLSDKLHQPVHLGYLSGRILPTPRLDLGEIYIGDAKQFQAATAQINFDIMGVFGDKKPIDSVDFQDVKVRGIALRDAAAWLQKLAGDKQYPVSRMTISQGTLDADAFQLTGVEGELNFNPAGKFTHARLSANSGKYSGGHRCRTRATNSWPT